MNQYKTFEALVNIRSFANRATRQILRRQRRYNNTAIMHEMNVATYPLSYAQGVRK